MGKGTMEALGNDRSFTRTLISNKIEKKFKYDFHEIKNQHLCLAVSYFACALITADCFKSGSCMFTWVSIPGYAYKYSLHMRFQQLQTQKCRLDP